MPYGTSLDELFAQDHEDSAHAAMSELLDHLVAAGKRGARGKLADKRLKGFRHGRRMLFGRRKRRAAVAAELFGLGIVRMTGRTPDGHCYPLLSGWIEISGKEEA